MDLFGDNLPAENYTVLARKYRPSTLDELIGQEALVRTLKNAIATGKLAHAFLLTGIRGVGKTSTARIIARVLNSIPPEQPVDSNIDVIEMDAASNTGVDNIREITENSKYKPLSSPYKIFIIDEVHMLSKGAFNALLKTLEEPPPHVIFLFCTTEIRKVPATILSRCQRFDLRRIDAEMLVAHLAKICEKEGVRAEEAALKLIALAAEGSVRDSLSLLDQAISFSAENVTAEQVRTMLGYADRSLITQVFSRLMEGDIVRSLAVFEEICNFSAEPEQVLRDLLDFSHLITRLKISPDLREQTASEEELKIATELAGKLSMMTLDFVWQMLLKSLQDIKIAPNPKHAAEMALIRISYCSELPDPRKTAPLPQATIQQNTTPLNFAPSPANFMEMAELFRLRKELMLYNHLQQDVHLVSYQPEKLALRPKPHCPADFANRITQCLNSWTGKRWMVILSNDEGEPTLSEQGVKAYKQLVEEALQHTEVAEVMRVFPGSKICEVKKLTTKNEVLWTCNN